MTTPLVPKAYLVLQVKQLRRALRVAEANRKASGGGPNHCIVLDGLVVNRIDGDAQVASYTFADAVEKLAEQTNLRATFEPLNSKSPVC